MWSYLELALVSWGFVEVLPLKPYSSHHQNIGIPQRTSPPCTSCGSSVPPCTHAQVTSSVWKPHHLVFPRNKNVQYMYLKSLAERNKCRKRRLKGVEISLYRLGAGKPWRGGWYYWWPYHCTDNWLVRLYSYTCIRVKLFGGSWSSASCPSAFQC